MAASRYLERPRYTRGYVILACPLVRFFICSSPCASVLWPGVRAHRVDDQTPVGVGIDHLIRGGYPCASRRPYSIGTAAGQRDVENTTPTIPRVIPNPDEEFLRIMPPGVTSGSW